MRLLHTKTGQFVNFPAFRDAQPYAILSHTWDSSGEQTYQDLTDIQASYGPDGQPRTDSIAPLSAPHGAVSSIIHIVGASTDPTPLEQDLPAIWTDPRLPNKICGACDVARKNGYNLIWIDSCCIDKTSSAELSESINSMYLWYSSSAVCYAFLADVPTDDSVGRGSFFGTSRWFKRAWTLQELVAPRAVEFLSQDWRPIGSKASLALVVEEVAGIELEVLTHRRSLDQEEILHRIPDQSLFAWTQGPRINHLEHKLATSFIATGRAILPISTREPLVLREPERSLFASSPSEFFASDSISRLGLSQSVMGRTCPPFEYVQMPYGLRAQFLMVRMQHVEQLSDHYYFLILPCKDVERDGEVVVQLCHLGLRLHTGGPRRLTLATSGIAQRHSLFTVRSSLLLMLNARVKTVYIPHHTDPIRHGAMQNARKTSWYSSYFSSSSSPIPYGVSLGLSPHLRRDLEAQGYRVDLAPERWRTGAAVVLAKGGAVLKIALHTTEPRYVKVTAIPPSVPGPGPGRGARDESEILLAILDPAEQSVLARMRFPRLVLTTAVGVSLDMHVGVELRGRRAYLLNVRLEPSRKPVLDDEALAVSAFCPLPEGLLPMGV
ncbi:hypothetical protein GSI_08724 [Ganoderma sinense ZZ0214-1]|uniref:Uncharacterized protein n=1 Tax=Ganoderma sinense ZZ0214-1 TaxID=1077348 RepID=A0A2G8S4H9_9APHY|nr:hypothetical protein GSI_08724 [Ganoderma sinense ZZ0214-1]